MRGGITTIGELLQRSRDDLLRIRNLGRKSLHEIEEKLNANGYQLRKETPEEIAAKAAESKAAKQAKQDKPDEPDEPDEQDAPETPDEPDTKEV